MNISLGIVEWEELEEKDRSTPGALGKKLAVVLNVIALATLASWVPISKLPL